MSLSFSDLLNSLKTTTEQQSSVTVTDNWMQGRTTYGGMSAAICYQAVVNDFPDLPPLRSAQINFIGPVGGEVSVTTKVMRQGRSVAYIGAEMMGEKGLATHAVFCFGENRESRLNQDFTDKPEVANVEQSSNFFGSGFGPSFANNYDCLLAQGGHPISGSDAHEHFIWVRHKDNNANDMAALIGISDMPPPAVLPMFKEFAPISSMTWMMNFLREDISTEDGWWLMRSAAEHARNGYSSQDMQVWNKAGNLVISARQNVAIFY
ncbi:MAG: thioesterase family protein [Arenicella sp.]|nr:thioesterase family protein [Arenicella sp.]